jgi:hypothetical protein
MKKLIVAVALSLPTVAQAAMISIYSVAGANTYQNTTNNPCVFFGPGESGCNQNPAGWSTVGDTGGGDPFNPNPLINSYGDAPGELALFADNVGRNFLLGLDINDTSTAQTLNNLTINFFNSGGTNIGTYTFSPPLAVANSNNGLGFADYVFSAGCAGTESGSGATATCTDYNPFSAPAGTTRIDFSFGLTGFNDGPDKLFLIGLGGVIPPSGDEPPDDEPPNGVIPEPTSLLLLGTGILALMRARKGR